MRLTILAALTLALGTTLAAADATPAAPQAVQASNTICPISGEKIDPSIAPVEAKTADGKTVEIGVCCEKCLAKIQKDPNTYADAALANKTIDQK